MRTWLETHRGHWVGIGLAFTALTAAVGVVFLPLMFFLVSPVAILVWMGMHLDRPVARPALLDHVVAWFLLALAAAPLAVLAFLLAAAAILPSDQGLSIGRAGDRTFLMWIMLLLVTPATSLAMTSPIVVLRRGGRRDRVLLVAAAVTVAFAGLAVILFDAMAGTNPQPWSTVGGVAAYAAILVLALATIVALVRIVKPARAARRSAPTSAPADPWHAVR